MKTVTVEQFKSFRPCWLETAEGRADFARIAAIRDEWTALDVLNLPNVSAGDKLWSVLREEFIDAPILHEFACRCAEYALSFVDNPDPQGCRNGCRMGCRMGCRTGCRNRTRN